MENIKTCHSLISWNLEDLGVWPLFEPHLDDSIMMFLLSVDNK